MKLKIYDFFIDQATGDDWWRWTVIGVAIILICFFLLILDELIYLRKKSYYYDFNARSAKRSAAIDGLLQEQSKQRK